jgi:hypothetical protein
MLLPSLMFEAEKRLGRSGVPCCWDGATTLSITTFSITTLSITTSSITTLSIKGLHVTLSISDTQDKHHSV